MSNSFTVPGKLFRMTSMAILTMAVALAGRPATAQSGAATCLVGETGGLDPVDATSATRLVCDELRSRGVPIGPPTTEVPASGTTYRVDINRLGTLYFVTLTQEDPPGTVADNRRLQIQGIEEMVVAAPRLADAMVRGVSTEETAQVGTLVGEETRSYESMDGDFFWGLGILAGVLVGEEVAGGPGLVGRGFYEAPRFGIGGDLRFLGSPDGEDGSFFFVLSVGGCYFFNPGNTGFYAGGGMAWHTLSVHNSEGTTGVGAYGNMGVELLRMHASRLGIDARVDVPFFTVDFEETVGETTTQNEAYVIPVSLAVYYAW